MKPYERFTSKGSVEGQVDDLVVIERSWRTKRVTAILRVVRTIANESYRNTWGRPQVCLADA